MQLIWKNCIFDLCGVTAFYREMFNVLVTITPEMQQEWLTRVETVASQFFPPHLCPEVDGLRWK